MKERWQTIIDAQSDDWKARAWCEFNNWRFPSELKQFAPPDFDALDASAAAAAIRPFANYISGQIGERAISRQWWRERFPDRTDGDHAKWWVEQRWL
jgi:hypothetical protein